MKHLSHNRIALLATLCLFAAGYAWLAYAEDAADSDFKKVDCGWESVETFDLPIAENGALSVLGFNGSITVESWEQDSISVEARKRVKERKGLWPSLWGTNEANDALNFLRELTIEVSGDAAHQRIETPRLKQDRKFNASVAYTVHLPAHVKLVLETTNGRVSIQNTNRPVSAKTTNGAIHVSDVQAAVKARTSNGSIKAIGLTQAFDAGTTNGSITGAYSVQIPPDATISCKTTNGRIELRAPAESAFTIDAKTTNGKIHSTFPIEHSGEEKKNRLRGQTGPGGTSVILKTTNGRITLEAT